MHGLTNDVMLRKDLILLRDLSHMDQGRKRFLARGWPCGKAGRRLSTGALQGASVRELGRPNCKAVTTGLYTRTSPRAFVCVTHANAQGPVGVNNHTPPAWERDGNTLRWLTRRFTRFTEVAHDTRRGEEL